MSRKDQTINANTSDDEDLNFIRLGMKGALEDKTEIYKDWIVAESRILGLKNENQELKEVVQQLQEHDNKDKEEMLNSIQIQTNNQIMEREGIIQSLKERIMRMKNQPKTGDERMG